MVEQVPSFVLGLPYWGKAGSDASRSGPDHHLLACHGLDVAAVGWIYLQRSPAMLRWIRRRCGASSAEAVLQWLVFWLAVHDLGKFSISFQGQRSDLVIRLQGEMPDALGPAGVRHDSLGLWLWDEVVSPIVVQEQWFGDDPDLAEGLQCWVRSVMGHHGQPPIEGARAMDRHFRAPDRLAAVSFVRAVRALLLTAEAAELPGRMGPDAFLEISSELSWWMAGLAILSDWIGSNADIFRYQDVPLPVEKYWELAISRAEEALRACGVIPPDRPCAYPFEALFPHIATPSPLQDWARCAPVEAGPQIHLLEDVTGAGKTEAAVMLVHRLMAAGCADGFFIGLPTMATANAMYGRIADLYDRLFTQPVSLALAHRNKRLVEDFARSVLSPGIDAHDSRQGDESATRRCTRWLADHNKRALLAPAGVGTIDQALLGALKSKHQSLRLLGLMHKVLVVDEVHACDAYMQRTLERLLEFHACAGGSAILLSATMTRGMKGELLKAFARGCGVKRVPMAGGGEYPLATSWVSQNPAALSEVPVETRPNVHRTIRTRYESSRAAVIDAIRIALDAGQCVAWIRNTISDALQAHAELSALVGSERIVLFHARFAMGDRLDIEARVLDLFGPDSGPVQRAGRLLIATQVAEQSLDIDLDLVVSDLAPIDRLIQRAGRMHRHARDVHGNRLADVAAPDQRAQPCLWVMGPVWTERPEPSWFKKDFPKSASVYPHHGHLWLTARHLQRGGFTMPNDARALIEGVFGDEESLPEGLQGNANQAEGKSWGDRGCADRNAVNLSGGYVRSGLDWDEDTVAPSRLGEDTLDVLLGRWVRDELQPWRGDKPAVHAWAYSTVRVARRLIARTAPETDPARKAALDMACETLPGAGKWTVFLVLDMVDGRGVGRATALQADGSERVEHWRYDADIGLVRLAPDSLASGAGSPST